MGWLRNLCRRVAEPPGPEFGALGERLEQAGQTDFFRWFHFEQVGQSAAQGNTITRFRPSGDAFGPLVSLQVTTDREGRMQALALAIQRRFIDDAKSAAFARDLAKSFLRSAIPAADQAAIGDLTNEIEFDLRGATVLTARRDIPALPAQPTPGYQVFLGQRERFALPLSGLRLELSNDNTEDGPALVLSLVATR